MLLKRQGQNRPNIKKKIRLDKREPVFILKLNNNMLFNYFAVMKNSQHYQRQKSYLCKYV